MLSLPLCIYCWQWRPQRKHKRILPDCWPHTHTHTCLLARGAQGWAEAAGIVRRQTANHVTGIQWTNACWYSSCDFKLHLAYGSGRISVVWTLWIPRIYPVRRLVSSAWLPNIGKPSPRPQPQSLLLVLSRSLLSSAFALHNYFTLTVYIEIYRTL